MTARINQNPSQKNDRSGSGFARRLDELSRRARWKLIRVELARSNGPLALWILAGASLALIGLPVRPELATTASLVFYAGAAILAWRGLHRYRPANTAAGRSAVDKLMEGEPASAQYDIPVPDTPAGRKYLAIHAERLAIQARSLRTPDTRKHWRHIDPLRLRWIAPLLFAMSVLYAQQNAVERLLTAMQIDIGTFAGAHRMTMQAWVTPPSYTGLAPFHIDNGQTVDTPEGSTVTVRLQGSGQPRLRLVSDNGNKKILRAKPGADGVFAFEANINKSVRVDVLLFGIRKNFALTSIPDRTPSAAFLSIPTTGDDDTLNFEWSASDDYGITNAFIDIKLADPEQNHSDEITTQPLTMSRIDPDSINDQANLNLTKHKWAGLKVQGNVRVTDARGQTGKSAAAFFTMPEKLFLVPLALASVEIRSKIMREQNNYPRQNQNNYANDDNNIYDTKRTGNLDHAPHTIATASRTLDALTYAPQGAFNDLAVFAGLRYARELLVAAKSLQEARKAQEVLWQVALRAELGSLADALRALNLARQELENALRDGAENDEVNRRIEALRQAIERYTQLAIERALEQENFAGGPSDGSDFDIDNFEEMLRALEDLAGTGARDQARQLLADMYNLLRSMQNLQLRSGGSGNFPGQNPQTSETDKKVEELADLLRDQRQLNDDTYQLDQENQQEQNQSQTEQQQKNGSQQHLPNQDQSLAERQNELRRRLGRMRSDGDADVQQFLDQALDEQKRAGNALSKGQPSQALKPQGQASDALRDAITELAEKADRERGDNDPSNNLDPLDRPSRGGGQSDRVMIPDEAERQRARDILDELLRRSMDPSIDEEQSEYLQRLLKRF